MRRKVLTILICLLVTVSYVSCGRINNPSDADVESIVNITEESADESLPTPDVTEKTVDLKKEEDVKATKPLNKEENVGAEEIKTEETENDVFRCTLSVSCDNVFKNITELVDDKVKILPQDGIIYPKNDVVFYEGESVFNVLSRELKKNKIHIDFENTPMYNTIYIKGISNLYERDCGELSGWIYLVNGEVPGYGCSQYILSDGDRIEFVYTCNLGKDIN